GRSWSKHGPINVPGIPFGIIQPTVFETSDGKLRFLCRATRQIGKICSSTSTDGGHTWSPAQPIDLPNPNSGIDAVRLNDGRILLVYNHTLTARSPLNVAISRDHGESFKTALELETAPGEYSYPAVIQTTDGRVHATYTWKREKIKHVSFDPSGLP
ncbi:MAG: exo-alpha-sialidase, partial [Planctomycetota bacterium]